MVGYLACGLVLATSSVNGLVYSTNGAKQAAAAGFILISMTTVRSLLVLSQLCLYLEPLLPTSPDLSLTL